MQTRETADSALKLIVAAFATICVILMATPKTSAEGKGPCAEDVVKFCKDVKPGEGNIVKCTKEHAQELSPGCKESLVETKQKIQEFSEVCSEDFNRLCKDVKPGGGRVIKCLKEHQQELSPNCKAKMSSAK